jgi:hypothetical protein
MSNQIDLSKLTKKDQDYINNLEMENIKLKRTIKDLNKEIEEIKKEANVNNKPPCSKNENMMIYQ